MIEIIPAIDMIGGKCVRLTQGNYDQKTTYYDDPLDVAMKFRDAGLHRLHMVDLDGAKASAPVNLSVLRRIAEKTGMDIQYGGGIKSSDSLRAVFENGASRAICGSVAVTSPDAFEEWLTEFGSGRIILGADLKDGFIATHGWLQSSPVTAQDLIGKFLSSGLLQVICTDISKDGMLGGPNFTLYEKLQSDFPTVDITVSGGIGSSDDIIRLNNAALRSVIVGKAIYENKITFDELARLAAM